MAIFILDDQCPHEFHGDLSFFHGNSIFTTLRSKQGELMLWDGHFRRLLAHAQFFGYELPHEQTLLDRIKPHLQACDKKIRIIIKEHRQAILLEPYQAPPARIYEGVQVVISKFQPHPQLAQFKTANSLPYMLAHKEAQERGAFEALMLNAEGHIVDGSRTSLLFFDGHTLHSLSGGLRGLMRECILAHAKDLGVHTRHAYVKEAELDLSQGQLLLSNSLIGLVPVGPVRSSLINELVNIFKMAQ